jgi:pyridinium-3,5-bisthiocarboxylic acid mononucleotide nickel chelatase
VTHVHIDMVGGLAGDMFLAAACDAGIASVEEMVPPLSSLGLGEVKIHTKRVLRGAFEATHLSYGLAEPGDRHGHRHLSTIVRMIQSADLGPGVKERAIRIFETLGSAEAHVHGIEIEKVHFHEVGAADSILDIVAAALVLEGSTATWSFDKVPFGRGTIETAHGIVPVPSPATARILAGFSMVARDVESELVTPTGAAILRNLDLADLRDGRSRTLSTTGYGAGTREVVGLSNVVRMMVFDSSELTHRQTETVVQLTTELDDSNPEVLAHLCQELIAAGALDVVTQSVAMKKGRLGTRLEVLSQSVDADRFVERILRETTTLGVRVSYLERVKLPRHIVSVKTAFGPVEVKVAELGTGLRKCRPEYEDCARVAAAAGVPLQRVFDAAIAAANELD